MDKVILVSNETASDQQRLMQAIMDYFKLLEMETTEGEEKYE